MLSLFVIVGFAVALLAPLCVRLAGPRWGPRWLLLYPVVVFGLSATSSFSSPQQETLFSWVPRYGLVWGSFLDGWSLLFALLISAVGTLVVAFAAAYLREHEHLGRFYLYLFGFMAAMLGLVLANNLLLLFVCWELTSVFSYLLIGFDHGDEKARKSALQALLTTGVGGLALLVAAVLLYTASGTWELAAIVQQPGLWPSGYLKSAIIALLFVAAFTKSAQFPFHYWLPAAMAAPTPVSAYLHSATMVKAGVYLLARFAPVFEGSWFWHAGLLAAGATTMCAGALLALPQRDLKLLLAYSTVSALGTLVFLLGMGAPPALTACTVFLTAHALYKGGLFLYAGTVDHATGTRDADVLGGLGRHLPLLSGVAILLALSMAGVVPFFGFVAKELAYEAVWQGGSWWMPGVLFAASALQVAVAGFVVARPVFAHARADVRVRHEPEPEMSTGPVLLAFLSLLFGLWPTDWLRALLGGAATAIGAPARTPDLGLWHGWTATFLLSLATLAAGGVAFACRPVWQRLAERVRAVARIGPASAYEEAVKALLQVADWQTRWLQSGRLRQYQSFVLFSVVVMLVAAAVVAPWPPRGKSLGVLFPSETAVVLAMLAGMVLTIATPSRLVAIAGLGVTGYGMGVLFLLFGAPDLAMTQFAIETLAVILLMLVLPRLPRFAARSAPATRTRDALLAATLGAGIAVTLVLLLGELAPSRLAPFFLTESVPAAHGRNVVNVILVDFRSLDTLGEITVLGLAALGVGALMTGTKRS